MRKYPIGLQDFKELRTRGFLYVDKTQLIHTLVESGKYYFLSRPRRFGKSLLLSTVKEIFNGEADLFKGLWIADHWDWQRRHPVIHISFASIGVRTLGLTEALFKTLRENAARLGVVLTETTIDQQFKELIRKAAGTGQVVILIDEYDKPIIDNLDNIPLAQENRSIFKSFYSVLKDADEYIRLLLITGVSKFTRVSIFSDLNNLNDITLHPKYATLAGITQQELETNFSQELSAMATSNPTIAEEIKAWYNGYSWHDGSATVYNPFSLLSFMESGIIRNFWFQTGTPTFLIEQIRKRKEFRFDGIRVGEIILDNFDIENISPATLLFQTGYLTIKRYDHRSRTYELDYPNKEVQSSLLDIILSAYREIYPSDSRALTGDIEAAFRENNIPKVMELVNTLISTIPYDHWRPDTESIFHIILQLTFKIIGMDIQSEVHSSAGRCDAIVQTDNHIYLMEFKLDGSAEQALDQILERGYAQPFMADKRQKTAVGINFSSKERKLEKFTIQRI